MPGPVTPEMPVPQASVAEAPKVVSPIQTSTEHHSPLDFLKKILNRQKKVVEVTPVAAPAPQSGEVTITPPGVPSAESSVEKAA